MKYGMVLLNFYFNTLMHVFPLWLSGTTSHLRNLPPWRAHFVTGFSAYFADPSHCIWEAANNGSNICTSMMETKLQFLAAGFKLASTQWLWSFGEWTSRWNPMLPRPSLLIALQINKQII